MTHPDRKEFNDRKSMYPRDPRYPATSMSINAHKLTRNGLDLHICGVTSMPINAHKLTRYRYIHLTKVLSSHF